MMIFYFFLRKFDDELKVVFFVMWFELKV